VRGFLPPVVEEVQGGHWVVVRQGDKGGHLGHGWPMSDEWGQRG
jgi:hypothetical protein